MFSWLKKSAAYDQGWFDAKTFGLNINPFPVGSVAYKEYERGFKAGL